MKRLLFPQPGRKEFDAVYRGTFLPNSIDQQSYFALYDGQNRHELVVKLQIPYLVPFGFHGAWVTGVTYNADAAAASGDDRDRNGGGGDVDTPTTAMIV